MVNSHIQLPHCVLEQFENDAKCLYYYDAKKERNQYQPLVSKGFAKSINTAYGYYSDEIEQYLGTIETPLGELIRFLNTNDFDAPVFDVPINYRAVIVNYTYALIARSKAFLDRIDKSSVFFGLLNETSKHDYAVSSGIEIFRLNKLFDEFDLSFLINKTSSPLLLPLCGMFSYSDTFIQIPLTPFRAVMLAKRDWMAQVEEGNVLKMLSAETESDVSKLNELAYQEEMSLGRGILISNDKNYLSSFAAAHQNANKGVQE